MIPTTEVRIANLVWENPGIHVRELSRRLKLGIPSIKYAIEKLKLDKIIKSEIEGRNLKFYINYNARKTSNYLSLLNVYNIQEKLPENVRSMLYELLKLFNTKPLMTIIFGSYAIGDYKETSDIDLLLIYADQDKIPSAEIEQKSKLISERYGLKISPVYLKWNEFKENFHNNRDKFIKQVKKNKIIFIGIEWWVMLENESS